MNLFLVDFCAAGHEELFVLFVLRFTQFSMQVLEYVNIAVESKNIHATYLQWSKLSYQDNCTSKTV